MASETLHLPAENFWGEYRAVVVGERVPAKAVEWYVRRAEQFVGHRDLAALLALTPDSVAGYFQRLFARAKWEEWQVAQVVDAVRLLCDTVLHLDWCAGFPWETWKQPHLRRAEIAAKPPPNPALAAPTVPAATSFADTFDGGEAWRRFPEPFLRLRTEIRTRHYSIRTETAYAMWLARFLAFRSYAAPETLGAADVRAYLEYLATVREIAASTQNQALCALVFFYG